MRCTNHGSIQESEFFDSLSKWDGWVDDETVELDSVGGYLADLCRSEDGAANFKLVKRVSTQTVCTFGV